MKFKTVADVFEKISHVSSRLEITSLLADLFKEATPDEARIISNFSLGLLRPSFEGTQFNFAEKNLLHVIGQLADMSPKDVAAKAKELGDLGSTAQALDGWKASDDLSVLQIYNDLVVIEQTSGAGSQEEKQNLALCLFQLLDPLSVKFVVRIILGTLRLGFSDMTILDALSWMEVGNKSLKKKLEHAYNICADIGLIAQTLKEDGIAGIDKMHIKLGTPIRMAAAERLPSAQDIIDKLGPCAVQPKLDGFRLQIHLDKSDPQHPIVRFFSRNLIDMSYMFPDLKEKVEQLDCSSLICEGEAIVFDPNTGHFLPFQETVKRKRKHGIDEAATEFPLQLFFFDLLYLDGKSCLDRTEIDRYDTLNNLVKRSKVSPTIQMIEQKIVDTAPELEKFFLQNIDYGLEGVVVKRPDSIYEPGKRNFNWIKLKRLEEGQLEDSLDCVVLGYYSGAGKRVHFGIGAFLVGIYNKEEDCFQSIAKIGTGLSDMEWKELKVKCDAITVAQQPVNVEVAKELYPDVWVQPEIVVLVLADEITKSPTHRAGRRGDEGIGYALRFPRFMGYRPDKTAEQSTSVAEIQRLYEDQFKKKKNK